MVSPVDPTVSTPPAAAAAAATQNTQSQQAMNSTTKVSTIGQLGATADGQQLLHAIEQGIALQMIHWSQEETQKEIQRAKEQRRESE